MSVRMSLALVVFWVIGSLGTRSAWAHCDTLDGPVVSAARQALASANVSPVLAWVQTKDEGEIRAAFEKALNVRRAGGEAR